MITKDEIQKSFTAAPEHLKAYIKSDELDEAFYQIRTTYKLHLDHAGNLALAIDAVVLGLKKFDELPVLLREALSGIDDATREKVLKDVNDKVFIPLRELTKKTAEEARTKLAAPKGPAVTVRPPTSSAQAPATLPQKPTAIKLGVEKPEPLATRLPMRSVVEEKLAQQPAPVIPVTTPTTIPTPTAPPQPQQITTAPPTTQAPPAPTPPPAAAPQPQTLPRYHGTDPYREPVE